MKRTRHILALIGLTALLAAGCGGGSDVAAPADPAQPANPGATPVGTQQQTLTDPNAPAPVGGEVSGVVDTPTGQGSTKIDSLADLDKGTDIFGRFADVGLDDPSTTTDLGDGLGTSVDDLDTCVTDPFTGASTGAGCEPTTVEVPEPVVEYTSAKLVVDGKTYTVTVGSKVPEETEQFTVTSISASTLGLGLTAGQFTDGSEQFLLSKGVERTLVNESEGQRYVLKLVKTIKDQAATSFS